jgi:hypothetical protein
MMLIVSRQSWLRLQLIELSCTGKSNFVQRNQDLKMDDAEVWTLIDGVGYTRGTSKTCLLRKKCLFLMIDTTAPK